LNPLLYVYRMAETKINAETVLPLKIAFGDLRGLNK
jgi:hypothetical protein